ncbi:phosphoadenylyl-sulfate reductase [Sulfurospirillum sp. T05]|uniref:Adenosine 5'-phosphosulfate reductase n=1 Tax=Sulfurospirillum tamanense TaxID=2813362 RepID=A0ABS2WRT8_9BACT|nr:phosphoadenylyl-sulfate reductase [Sulfurospirillum tamanensis]MBN2964391.1 phosphoadenylyl-sulfate reductase [Sulfurospirillum tamanensis]
MKDKIVIWREATQGKTTQEVLDYFLNTLHVKIAFASSLGVEDQVLSDLLYKTHPNPRIFTLDTGRLPAETYALLEKTRTYYGKPLEVFFPKAELVEPLVSEKGMFSFYASIKERKACCYVRKIEPLKRALAGLEVWMTGLRRAQSVTREKMECIEWDEANGLVKLNPLIEWSEEEVWEYVRTHNVPVNALHAKGYPSIGCAPCTRAVKEGEDVRSGRWWWENPEHKECGLHAK